MSESAFPLESTVTPASNDEPRPDGALDDDATSDDAPPEFGLVDIVEAFTAMRHEWRGQTKESRTLASSVQDAVTTLQALEEKMLASAAGDTTNETRNFAELITDTDHQLTRAVEAAGQSETNRQRRENADAQAIQQSFVGMNALARWFARPLLTTVTELREAREQTAENPAIEGLNLVLARLRRMMKEHNIERIDTQGQEFDPNTMNAIGTVDSQKAPPGHVAEQLSPCYRWQGQLLRFADVRVTTLQPTGIDSAASVQ